MGDLRDFNGISLIGQWQIKRIKAWKGLPGWGVLEIQLYTPIIFT